MSEHKHEMCGICCQPLFKHHKKIDLDCCHTYHYKCMKSYIVTYQNFERGLQCPYCRRNAPLSLLLPSSNGKKNIDMIHPLKRCLHKKCKNKEFPFNAGYCRTHKDSIFSEEDLYKISKSYYLGLRKLSTQQKVIYLFIVTCLVKLKYFDTCEDLIDYIHDKNKQFLLERKKAIFSPTLKLKTFLNHLNIPLYKNTCYFNSIITEFFNESPKKTPIQKLYNIDYSRIFN